MFHRTERLLLRLFWPEDASAVLAGINNPLILKNLSSPPCPYCLADAEAFCALPFDIHLPNFAMVRRTNGAPELIGSIGLGTIPHDAPQAGAVQIGYWLDQRHWGLGYATEAARAVLDIADALGHRQLIRRHFVDNPASGRVLSKLGFRPTGRVVPLSSPARGQASQAVEMVRDSDAVPVEDDVEGDAPRARFRMMYADSELVHTPLAA